jgi:hypothetical protein
MVFLRALPALLFAVVLLVSCSGNRLTGTTDETVVTARVYNPDHSPAVNATVKVFDSGDTSRIPLYQTTTGKSGEYAITTLGNGMYNVLVGKDSLGAFQDSMIIRNTYSTLANDTLALPVVLSGLVIMQPMHDPRTVTVQILGTDMYSNVSANGSFVIGRLPPGNYALRSVTTVAEYTPTYTWLTVPPLAQDTVRDTIELIYTGIPAVKSISAIYDTLRGIVHLAWDTVDYPSLRDFLVYRDDANLLTPSTQPIGTSPTCTYNDTITNVVNAGFTEIAYRVAVRAKNLAVGQTFTDLQITVVAPLTVYPFRDTLPAYLGVPHTLRINVNGYAGNRVSYAWDIGNKGVFVPSLQPDTTIVLHDTITQDYESVVKVLVDNKTFALDTIRLATQFGWQKVAAQFTDSTSTVRIHTTVMNDNLFAFTDRMVNTTSHWISVWQSADGLNWTKIVDSLAFPCMSQSDSIRYSFLNKPVVFLNKICLADNDGYIWTSADGIAWNKTQGGPFCKTITDGGASWAIWPGTKCPPALFVEGDKIFLQPFQGTGSDKILSSTDLITWDSLSGYQMQSVVSDFAELNGTLAVAGIDFSGERPWLCLKNSGGTSFPTPPSGFGYWGVGMARDPYIFNLKTYKDRFLISINYATIWTFSNVSSQQWFACATAPVEAAGRPFSFAVLKNELFLVSTSGVFKATN